MSTRHILISVVSICAGTVIAETFLPQGFADAIAKSGKSYLDAVAVVTNVVEATVQLKAILAQEPAVSTNARLARIMLARVEHPEIFGGFNSELQTWKAQSGKRPGFLSGALLQFVKRGPEDKYVEDYVRDNNGKIVFEPSGSAKGSVKLKGMRAKSVRIEKYTDIEVQAGIARNAAARQAVLERFLKLLDEGDAYEQSEMVDLINRLWGRDRIKRTVDLTVVDNVPDADALFEAVFKDLSRPEAARMRAAYCLPNSKKLEVRAFMLGVVTNNPAEYKQSYDVVDRALVFLESGADANELAVLKSQTNAPAWKREKIEKTIHAIEIRQAANPKPTSR